VLFDSEKLTLEVRAERILEISLLVESWFRKKKASLKELQSLLGTLHFISACVRPGRIFVSRLLNCLRSAFPCNNTGNRNWIFRKIPSEVLKDLKWWHVYLQTYNGITMMPFNEWSNPDEHFSCDACLEGLGAINSDQYFHAVFPSFIQDLHLYINSLELLTIVVSLKMWGKHIMGKRL
jgi:hypothetical protein